MKRIKNILSLLLILGCMGMVYQTSAQVDKGTMTLEITDVTSDNPQVAQMAEMMKGNETVVHFKGKESLTKMNMMGGMVKIDLKMSENEDFDMLMDAMGQKIWVNTPKLEMDKMKAETDNPMEYMEISYDEADKKTIAGYECYKMSVVFPDQEGATLEAYISEELKMNAPVIQGVEMKKFKGFPLEYNFNNGMMTLSVVAKSFEPTVDESVFELNTSGYQKMTMAELMEMSGGMGGGFGF